MKRIAFVRCTPEREYYEEDREAAKLLEKRGATAEFVQYDTPGINWAGYDAIVLHSCVEYNHAPEAFNIWLETIQASGKAVGNPTDVVRWNMHKFYLRELEAKDFPTIPTEWVERGTAVSLPALLAKRGWAEAVVKPAISAGGKNTWRVTSTEAESKQAAFAELLMEHDILVQQYLSEIAAEGEWSLIYIRGEFSHALLKKPESGNFLVHEEFGGSTSVISTPPVELVDYGKRLVETVSPGLLYARVDGVRAHGSFLLMELEIIEPQLWAHLVPSLSTAYAEAIWQLANER